MNRTLRLLLFLAAVALTASLTWTLWLDRTAWLPRLLLNLPVILLIGLDLRARRRLGSSRDLKTRTRLAALLFLGISAVFLTYAAAVAYADYRLASRSFDGIVADCHKVWSTRGLVHAGPEIRRDGAQNSIEAIRLAFDEGARGVEVDVFFDPELGQYVVSHDRPYNLKNGRILNLEELLAAVGDRGHFWIDFKKLRHLERPDLERAVARLEALTQGSDLRQRVYVEGEAPLPLAAFRKAGFHTILDTHPLPDGNLLTPALVNLYKLLFHFGGHTVMAMEYGEPEAPVYGPRTRHALGRIPLFLYHIPDDDSLLESLGAFEPVRVLLPVDQSRNVFGISACP